MMKIDLKDIIKIQHLEMEIFEEKVRKCIYSGMWDQQDITFKPICDEIRKLGYEVIS